MSVTLSAIHASFVGSALIVYGPDEVGARTVFDAAVRYRARGGHRRWRERLG